LQSLDNEDVDIIGSTLLGTMEMFATDVFTDTGESTVNVGNISRKSSHNNKEALRMVISKLMVRLWPD
jgi:hypothetical protein